MAFLGQTFNQGLYCLDYLVRKKQYMERCINKARPQLHCNGKCQLMKKMQEQQKKEQGQAPELKLASRAEAISSKSFFPSGCLPAPVLKAANLPVTVIGSPVDRPSAFFHPPDTAA